MVSIRAYTSMNSKTKPCPPRSSAEPQGVAAEGALALYRGAWGVASVVAPLMLRARAGRGKEDPARIGERQGRASRARPEGILVWVHGASVGESLATLPLVSAILEKPDRNVLVTTGTVTSARLMAERLPARAFHQYAPLDSPASVRRFLDHWRPDLALFVESEFWPNLILETRARHVPMALINARISERSFRGWNRASALAKLLLSSFDECLAQDDVTSFRLKVLGARSVKVSGSLKADAPPLPFEQAALDQFKAALGSRPLFLAASTHPGEEELLLDVALSLRADGAEVLTVIVPRHPSRGPEVERAALAKGFTAKRRSTGVLPDPETEVYIADTLGELGLFYRAASFAFLGGSLIAHGGQNPLEPARLGTAVLTGPHTHNFDETFRELLAAQGEGLVRTAEELRVLVARLIEDRDLARRLGERAQAAAAAMGGALEDSIHVAEALLAHHASA
jgi:3-deoxy-D-manno-octulosonic-acid transferase